jgi:hypothetical protein
MDWHLPLYMGVSDNDCGSRIRCKRQTAFWHCGPFDKPNPKPLAETYQIGGETRSLEIRAVLDHRQTS